MFANSLFDTTNMAALATIPLFILMGEILFRSGTMEVLLDSVDKLVGRITRAAICVVNRLVNDIRGAVRSGHGGRGNDGQLLVSKHDTARL